MLHHGALMMFRRSFGVIIKKLNSNDLNEYERNGWTNVLTSLPYMLLQYEKGKPDDRRCSYFFSTLINGDILSLKVGDFKKKSMKARDMLNKKLF